MIIKYLFLITLTFTTVVGLNCHAQQSENIKIEREFRIDRASVPQKAQEFIAAFPIKGGIKWLREQGEERASIEAKFKYQGHRYSVEFTTEGILEDLEIVIKESELPESTRAQINEYFKKTFDYYKIEKIQAQYVNTEASILDFFITKTEGLLLKPNYEIVVKTRNSGMKSKRYEMLFTEDGLILDRSQVSIRRDNILRF